MVAYLYRMPAGIPGDITRSNAATVEPMQVQASGATGAPTQYGVPMVIDATSKNARMVGASDTAALVKGFLVRPYPTNSGQDALNVGTPNITAGAACDIMRRGYMSILLNFGTAAKGGQVYVWKAATSAPHVQGGLEATDPTTNGFAVTGAFFMGPADSNGQVEIEYNI